MNAVKVTMVCAALVALLVSCVGAAVPLRSRTTCLEAVTNKVYSLGETWYTTGTKGCMRLTCDGEDTISGLTCAQFQVPSWCSIKPGDMEAVYPDCCPSPVCPEENAIEGSTGGFDVVKGPGIPSPAAPSGPYGGYPYPPERF